MTWRQPTGVQGESTGRPLFRKEQNPGSLSSASRPERTIAARMCGIVGFATSRDSGAGSSDLGSSDSREIVQAALERLRHRGPDDEGLQTIRFAEGELVLGSRRLAILDPSPAGRMPMQDTSNGNWITYNGEIFNFKEVRDQLQREGIAFVTDSDTEVVLKAYSRWGPECLRHFRGMFAFAIWDHSAQRLFLARDRFGIKPLYFCSSAAGFMFSSELRAILHSGIIPAKIGPVGLFQYLLFGSCSDPDTILEGVKSVLPGHYLLWGKGSFSLHQYWKLSAAPRVTDTGLPEVQEHVNHLLDQAVSLRTVSDVPISIFLSGGIDSSAIAAILKRTGKWPIDSFSVVFHEAEFNEARYSRLVAGRLQTNHHELMVSQKLAIASFPDWLHSLDQPSIDGFNSFVISRETRRSGFKVAISGIGGDEVFAGYPTFRSPARMKPWQQTASLLPSPVRRLLGSAIGNLGRSDQARKLATLLSDSTSLPLYGILRMLFTPEGCSRLLPGVDSQITARAMRPLLDSAQECDEHDEINRTTFMELTNYMRNTLLRDADAMSMAHGLELRLPLLDHLLVEYLYRIPGRLKLSTFVPKPLLTNSVFSDLPSQAIHRPKKGFAFPFEHWLKGNLRSQFEQEWNTWESSPISPYISKEEVWKIWRMFLQGSTSWSRPWALFVISRWSRRHISA